MYCESLRNTFHALGGSIRHHSRRDSLYCGRNHNIFARHLRPKSEYRTCSIAIGQYSIFAYEALIVNYSNGLDFGFMITIKCNEIRPDCQVRKRGHFKSARSNFCDTIWNRERARLRCWELHQFIASVASRGVVIRSCICIPVKDTIFCIIHGVAFFHLVAL